MNDKFILLIDSKNKNRRGNEIHVCALEKRNNI